MEWIKVNLPPEGTTVMGFWKNDEGPYEMMACFFSEGEFCPTDSEHSRLPCPLPLPDYWRLIKHQEFPE